MDLEALARAAGSAWVIWLLILFVGIVFRAFRPKNKRRFEKDGKIPFRDENDGD